MISSNGDIVVRLSTASLTSSSSSGSEPRIVKSCTTPVPSIGSKPSTSDLRGRLTSTPTSSTSTGTDITDGVPGCSTLPATAASSPKPSTGAIPKSISFDMTAERGDKEMLDDDQKGKRGFFGKLKLTLRNRRGKSIRGPDEMSRCYERGLLDSGNDSGGGGDARHRLRRIMSEDVTSTCSGNSGKIL